MDNQTIQEISSIMKKKDIPRFTTINKLTRVSKRPPTFLYVKLEDCKDFNYYDMDKKMMVFGEYKAPIPADLFEDILDIIAMDYKINRNNCKIKPNV